MHTVAYYTKRFNRYWTASLESRYIASTYYAQAKSTLSGTNQQAFRNNEADKNFTDSQWGVIGLVGANVIIKEYLDCPKPGIPIVMARLKVKIVDQVDIWHNGLEMTTIGGGTKTVMIPAMRESDICQVFKADGSRRTPEEQVKWLEDLVRPALEVLENHSIYVAHRMYIQPEKLVELLIGPIPPLPSKVLIGAGIELQKRGV